MEAIFNTITHNKMVILGVIVIIFDVILGTLRAIKERDFNSSVGIDGMIRKVCMLISLVALAAIDSLLNLNFIGFVPEDIINAIGVKQIALCEFFALLFTMYEIVSVLKNWTLCGIWLPTKLKDGIYKWLENMTGELPS